MNFDDLYKELEILKHNEYKRIVLVRSEIDHLLYVKKEYYQQIDHYLNLYMTIKKLKSPYFPEINQIFQKDNSIVIIEKYINAPTLDRYIYNQNLTIEKINKIYIQILKAVKLLHDQEPPIIHRDIKPENIICYDGRIYLLDFDISRYFDENKNRDTVILGSAGYASPEQFGFRQSDKRSDIYSLGILYHFMMTKKLPGEMDYQGKGRSIIDKCIHIDPEQRYQSVDEILDVFGIKSQSNLFYTIPGFKKNQSVIARLFIFALYIFIFICGIGIEVEGQSPDSLITWMYRIVTIVSLESMVLLGFDFGHFYSYCLFNHSESKMIRIIGIIITCMMVFIVEVVFFSMIISLFI